MFETDIIIQSSFYKKTILKTPMIIPTCKNMEVNRKYKENTKRIKIRNWQKDNHTGLLETREIYTILIRKRDIQHFKKNNTVNQTINKIT